MMLGIEITNPPRRQRIVLRRIDSGKDDGLVTPQASAFVHWMGVTAPELQILPRPDHEESRGQCELVEAGCMNVSAVHDIKCTGLGRHTVQDAVIADASRGDLDEGGNAASQIQQGMQLNGSLAMGPGSPW